MRETPAEITRRAKHEVDMRGDDSAAADIRRAAGADGCDAAHRVIQRYLEEWAMNTGVMFSSKTDLWETPQALFDELNAEFSFTLDVCALPTNAKCADYYTPDMDGLQQPWQGRVWCNPPYGRQIGKWVEKAANAVESDVVVMLLPARTDTKWFHEYIYNRAEIRFLKGRLKFGGGRSGAPFPSMVVVFREGER